MVLVSESLLVVSLVLIAIGLFLIIAPFPYPVVYVGWLFAIVGGGLFIWWAIKQGKAS
jgi:hypothetical protein